MNGSVLRLSCTALLVFLTNSLPAAEPRVLIPCADEGGAIWQCTTEKPGDDWTNHDFDDSKWSEGKAGFGVPDHATLPATIGTTWTTPDIWLRTTIDVTDPVDFEVAAIRVKHDEDVELYVNGKAVFTVAWYNTQWETFDVTESLRSAIKPGPNLVAVHVHQTAGGQYIDLGLALDPKEKPANVYTPFDFAAIEQCRQARWAGERAWEWYTDVGPIAGCNYLPRTAVNMTQMWQKETFDPKTIDEELGWAEKAGYNSLRVFVQYLVWRDDPEGLKQRMDQFLTIADKHGMRVMLIPFCDCAFAGREPYLGKQDEPVPGVHNSGWVPSPGLKRVVDRTTWPDLERYIKDLVGRFAEDRRVLIWDLYNEPGNSNMGEKSLPLVAAAFRWAREAGATQPLTVGAWTNFEGRMSKALMEMSDVVSFHGYDQPDGIASKSRLCRQYHRPILCTEWLHRQSGNTFETILPIFAQGQIGGYHWGFVAGRTQTYMPWGSKQGDPMPKHWQHDVLHADGTPYDASEFELLRQYSEQFLMNRPWSKQKASKWFDEQPWPCGFNYIPANAISYTEMWMPYCFDRQFIDKELALAEDIGFNCLRVVLPFVVWEHDPAEFKKRLESFLTVCDKRGIKVMFTLFDDCAFGSDESLKNPTYGKQPEVLEGWYANGWTPSPGHAMVRDPKTWPRLEKYVKDVIGTFKEDRRVWVWDLYNEPTNGGLGNVSIPLVENVFRWAREVGPSQPLTIGQWNGNAPLNDLIFTNSDIVTFHNYGSADGLTGHIQELQKQGRPLINTEWLNRGHGSLVESCLPVFAKEDVGCMHWGLVNGRTQTDLAWGWRPGRGEPKVWQHDLFHANGKPYRPEEIELFREYMTAQTQTVVPVTYKGWKAHLLENDLVRLHVVPEIGGRVIQYALGEKEFFWVNPAVTGKTSPKTGLDPEGGWLNYGGDKLWPAPQGWDNNQQWPGPPDAVLDGQPYQADMDRDSPTIHLTSRDDPRSGIRFSRRIHLDPRSTHVSIEATMTNIDDKPRRWGIWAHTQLDAGLPGSDEYNRLMRAWCPINPRSRFDRGYEVIFGEENNPSFDVDVKRGLMQVSYQYKVGKIGLDSRAGWVATVDGRNGDVFVQRFQFEPEKEYPEGSSVEFWHNGVGRIYAYNEWMEMADNHKTNPYVFESEILSPYARLQPNESYTWAYDWYACRIGGDFPVVDCSEVGVVSEPLTRRRDGDRVRLRGRFGVFQPGRLVLEISNGNADLIATELLDANVTPSRPVVLDLEIKLPAEASDAALVLHDSMENRIGQIAWCGF
jgi:uncharacterized protein DUF4380/cellulase (glycosyl hydrolase family 5)